MNRLRNNREFHDIVCVSAWNVVCILLAALRPPPEPWLERKVNVSI